MLLLTFVSKENMYKTTALRNKCRIGGRPNGVTRAHDKIYVTRKEIIGNCYLY